MDLRSLTRSVQEQLAAGAAVGDESTRRAAQLLSVSLEPALRLALQEAVGQVAAEVSADLAPGRVDLALVGGELTVQVVPPPTAPAPAAAPAPPAVPTSATAPTSASAPQPPPAPAGPAPEEEQAEAGTARVTFRPPQPLKARLERAAAEEALSLNTYLVRALSAHLDQPAPAPSPAPSSVHGAGRTSGWFL
ncbi:hypothetical protein ACT3SP_09255 [Brachybacterium sp. AOP43-C2-M15]|uniref:hypothetical protein n=1 Tax=Brachybacterium sp. AOP43-C2-M15 TaxID=3457661 RepID=UPI0040348831